MRNPAFPAGFFFAYRKPSRIVTPPTEGRFPMSQALDDAALAQLFLDARTHNAWQQKEVPDSLLVQLVDMLKMGPTSANCSPARIVFVKSQEAKERLKPFLSSGNREK